MKVLVLGAAGKLGRKVVASCLARGHEVTAATRKPVAASPSDPSNLRRALFDIHDGAALEAALGACDALVSAAGTVSEGDAFVATFDRVASAAERVLGGGRRVWMLAGAAVLDMPRTGRPAITLPFVPARYRPHLENWRRLERSRLDWALMCPGFMVADDGASAAAPLRVAVDALPFEVSPWVRYAPPIALSLLMKSRLPALTVSYADVADAIADRLEPGGPCARKRVGVAYAEADAGARAA